MQFRGILMQFNQINIARAFVKEASTDIQSKIKEKENNTSIVIKNLKRSTNKTISKADVSAFIDYMYGLYMPVTDAITGLSIREKRYNQYTDELKRTDLSEEERNKIKLKLNIAKEDIKFYTSPNYISRLNDEITNKINPRMNEAKDTLKNKFGIDIDDDSLNMESMESMGISSNNNNFEDIFEGLKKAISYIHKKVLKLCDIDEKYGDRPNKNLAGTLDISV